MNLYEVEYYTLLAEGYYTPGHATVEADSAESARKKISRSDAKMYVGLAYKLNDFTQLD